MDASEQKLLGGVGILALAVTGYLLFSNGDDTDTVDSATCALTALAVPIFVEAATGGKSPSTLNSVSGILTGAACKAALQRLQEDPEAPVALEVETGGGQTVERDVTLPDLTIPPARPATPQVPFDVLVACAFSYDSTTESLLLELCYDGFLPPRA